MASIEKESPAVPTLVVEPPEPTDEPIADFDEDDDGIHPWFIAGPIIGLVVAGLIAFFTFKRKRGYS